MRRGGSRFGAVSEPRGCIQLFRYQVRGTGTVLAFSTLGEACWYGPLSTSLAAKIHDRLCHPIWMASRQCFVLSRGPRRQVPDHFAVERQVIAHQIRLPRLVIWMPSLDPGSRYRSRCLGVLVDARNASRLCRVTYSLIDQGRTSSSLNNRGLSACRVLATTNGG